LMSEYMNRLPITSVKLGKNGINKSIHIGVRETDSVNPHILAFLELAKSI
jgi:LysR family transcriptional regulator for metE and metH